MDCRDTVGMVRIGAIGRSGSVAISGAAIAWTGMVEVAASSGAMGSGSATSRCTAAAREARADRRCTGAGMDPATGASTARVRATTRPGAARLLTSWPSG